MNINNLVDRERHACQMWQAAVLLKRHSEDAVLSIIKPKRSGHYTKWQSYTRYKLMNKAGDGLSFMLFRLCAKYSYEQCKLNLRMHIATVRRYKKLNHGGEYYGRYSDV